VKPLACFVLVGFGLVGCAASSSDPIDNSPDNDITKDACAQKALTAAEKEYDNDPMRTKTIVLTKSVKYVVTVGIGNPEDGAHDYYVTFPSGCSSTPKVTEVPSVPHPLRDAMHGVYEKLLAANGYDLPKSVAIAPGSLPAAAKKQFDDWTRAGKSSCLAVASYKVAVSGQDTFAVSCSIDNTGMLKQYDLSFAVWDSTGSDIDQATTFFPSSTVAKAGVRWQDETFEEKFH
jgi:hypothetical protein